MSGSIQTTYGKRQKGFAGGVANSNPVTSSNLVAEEAIGIGKFCKVGTTGAINLAGSADVIVGMVLKSDAFDKLNANAGENITVGKKGSFYAYCETDCVEGGTVFVRHTINGALIVGDVRKDLDTDKAKSIGATFAETLSSAGLVEINLNL